MTAKFKLFEAYGIEIEYMIVDKTTLHIIPISDKLLEAISGKVQNEVSLGEVNISNELVLHVIEFKSHGPKSDLKSLAFEFQKKIEYVNQVLDRQWHAKLLPTAMHPFMSASSETYLWPHGNSDIYQCFDRIFNCKGHGWSNLQSMHINLPFDGDEEFARLHAAIRIVLALLPGLAASSPIVEAKLTGTLDNRLLYYSKNQKKVPSIIGSIIPEKAFSKAEYQSKIYERIRRDMAPLDPEHILEEEWLNSRAAIARFDRSAIEIRLLDTQECVFADLAIASLVISLIQSLCDGKWLEFEEQKTADERKLKILFLTSLKFGEDTLIADDFILNCFKLDNPLKLGELWRHIFKQIKHEAYPLKDFTSEIEKILARGSLAKLITKKLAPSPTVSQVRELYHCLSEYLNSGTIYEA